MFNIHICFTNSRHSSYWIVWILKHKISNRPFSQPLIMIIRCILSVFQGPSGDSGFPGLPGPKGPAGVLVSRVFCLFIFWGNQCDCKSIMCLCVFQGFSGPAGPVGMIGPVGTSVSVLRRYACYCWTHNECQIKDVLDAFSGCQRTQRKPWRDGKMHSSYISSV